MEKLESCFVESHAVEKSSRGCVDSHQRWETICYFYRDKSGGTENEQIEL